MIPLLTTFEFFQTPGYSEPLDKLMCSNHLFSRPWASRALHACKSMAWPNRLDIFLCRGTCPQNTTGYCCFKRGDNFPFIQSCC